MDLAKLYDVMVHPTCDVIIQIAERVSTPPSPIGCEGLYTMWGGRSDEQLWFMNWS
jgi:hypothetical protein